MEAMTPWLLLIIAALIVACVSLYFHLRQVESQSRGEQSIITDELRDAEAALTSVLEKIQRMDRELAAREQALSVSAETASLHEAGERAPRSRGRMRKPPIKMRVCHYKTTTRFAGTRRGLRQLPPAGEQDSLTVSAGLHDEASDMRTGRPHSGNICTPSCGPGGQGQNGEPPETEGAGGERAPVTGTVSRRETPPVLPLANWRERAVEMARSGMMPREIARELELPVGEVELALALRS